MIFLLLSKKLLREVVKRILIIDDEKAVLLMLRQILEGAGYEVLEALNGQAGMDLFDTYGFDLVITDMVMPVQDGLKTIMAITEMYPQLPIIAISGGGAVPKERYLTVAGYLGQVYTMPKPVDRLELLDAVEELLKES